MNQVMQMQIDYMYSEAITQLQFDPLAVQKCTQVQYFMFDNLILLLFLHILRIMN